MKMLFSATFVAMMLPMSHCDHVRAGLNHVSEMGGSFGLHAQDNAPTHVEPAKIAGAWKMSMETPHGMVSGPLVLKQDGSKVTGTYEVEHIGSMTLTGKVEGKKVSFSMEIPGADMSLTMTGTVDGDKMSGGTDHAGPWTATRQQ